MSHYVLRFVNLQPFFSLFREISLSEVPLVKGEKMAQNLAKEWKERQHINKGRTYWDNKPVSH